MAGAVIVSGDWQSRALLRAQLIEEGCEVRAYESLADAASVLVTRTRVSRIKRFHPGLLVADLSSDGSDREVNGLSVVAQRMPVWVIAGRSSGEGTGLRDRGFERVIFRPIDMGVLVEEIKQRLARCDSQP